jgi:tetrahydromethanopterin S-methyltransferase subunit G
MKKQEEQLTMMYKLGYQQGKMIGFLKGVLCGVAIMTMVTFIVEMFY